jgi:hypothetical protein
MEAKKQFYHPFSKTWFAIGDKVDFSPEQTAAYLESGFIGEGKTEKPKETKESEEKPKVKKPEKETK